MIYLAKKGKIYGPIQPEVWTQMQADGRAIEYFWLWTEATKQWQPVEAAPLEQPSPETALPVSAEPLPEPSRQGSKRHVPKFTFPQNVEALCHDFRAVVIGTIEDATERGGFLLAQGDAQGPQLARNAPVVLNLLDSKSGKSINLKAHVTGVSRDKRGWAYELRWDWEHMLAPALAKF